MDTYTVVVTCFREGPLLERAVRSLFEQTDRDFEILVVNDASPCETTNLVCRGLEQTPGVRVLWRSRNGGLSAARNDGFRHAKGSICLFLDADDELPADAVSAVKSAFRQFPEADFVFGNYLRRDVETGAETEVDCRVLCGDDGWLDPGRLLQHWVLSGHTACRKTTWQRAGGYGRRFSYGYQDVDFWMRALYKGCRGVYAQGLLYVWNRSGRGMNEQRAKRWRYFRAASVRYYEAMGRDPNIWERVVLDFLDNRAHAQFRAEARAAWMDLIPARAERWWLFLKFTLLVCGPAGLDQLLSKRAPKAR